MPSSDPPGIPAGEGGTLALLGDRVPALDGIRGLAILLVIWFHHTILRADTPVDRVFVSLARLGWCGVDLFFVLSGFLITGILYDSKGGRHYFRNFYVRRTLRIFPLYYAVVIFSLAILPRAFPESDLAVLGRMAMADRSAAWYWLYLSNFLVAADHAFRHPVLAISWSLAIEEQFYLVWAVAVRLLTRRGLMWLSGTLIVMSPALRATMALADVHPAAIYALTLTRMDALAAGAFVALALRGGGEGRPAQLATWARRMAPAALALVLAIWYLEEHHENYPWGGPTMQTVGYTVLALGFASLIVLSLDMRRPGRMARLFSQSWLRMFGKYSYALYLCHVPVRRVVRDGFYGAHQFPTLLGSPLPGQLLFYVVALAPAFALAWASWHLYEKQALKLKRFFPYDGASRPSPGRDEPISDKAGASLQAG